MRIGSKQTGRLRAFALSAIVLLSTCGTRASAESATVSRESQVFVFRDLSLNAAEEDAVSASPDVAVAVRRLERAQAALSSARLSAAPSLTATYAGVPQGNPPGQTIRSTVTTVGLQVTLGDLLAYSALVRQAAYALAAAQANKAVAEDLERSKTATLYSDALSALAATDARVSARLLAQTQARDARVRLAAGDAPRLDVIRADVATARADAALALAENTAANAVDALRIETNVSASALLATIALAHFTENDQTDIDRFADPQIALVRAQTDRPELLATWRSALAAQAGTRAARAGAYPAITLGGGFMTGTDSGAAIAGPTINASLTLPFSSAARDRVRDAVLVQQEAQLAVASSVRTILRDVAASARALTAAKVSAEAMLRARLLAKEELEATLLGYTNRVSSSFEVDAAREAYMQASIDEVSARYEVEKARAVLAIEIGR